MPTVWFVVPVHGREALTRVCLRQLRRTCDAAAAHNVDASAVIVGDDASVDVAEELGFATVRRDNSQLGTKFNDGYQLACDPKFNPEPVDYVVPCGSDDWIDPIIFRQLPVGAIGVFKHIGVVNPERTRIAHARIGGFANGAGIRIIPAEFVAKAGYRPAEEHRNRAIDASTYAGLRTANSWDVPPTVELDSHPWQIVDWKSRGEQLNGYELLRGFYQQEYDDPFAQLAEHYPAEALEEIRAL